MREEIYSPFSHSTHAWYVNFLVHLRLTAAKLEYSGLFFHLLLPTVYRGQFWISPREFSRFQGNTVKSLAYLIRFLCTYWWVLHILGKGPLSDASFANIFCQSGTCLITLFALSFAEWKFLSPPYQLFHPCFVALVLYLKVYAK